MVSAGCVQNVPEASSSLCFVPNPADRVSLTHGHLPRGHGAKGQQHVCDDPTNASAPQPGAAKRRGRWIAALLFKVDDSLDFNPGLSGAPGELCPGQIQMYRGTGCAAGWAGSVPPAGRERSQPCVAPGPGSCRPTRPLGSAMRSLFAAAAARGGPCQVSSRCSRVTTCTAPCSAAFFFLFPAGRFSWPLRAGGMLVCGLLDRALRSFLLQLFLPSLPAAQNCLPAFPLGCAVPGVPRCPLWCLPVLSQRLPPPCFGCRELPSSRSIPRLRGSRDSSTHRPWQGREL